MAINTSTATPISMEIPVAAVRNGFFIELAAANSTGSDTRDSARPTSDTSLGSNVVAASSTPMPQINPPAIATAIPLVAP